MTTEERLSVGSLSGMRILVLGLGVEGMSVLRFLENKDAKITVHDPKARSEFKADDISSWESRGVEFVFGTPEPAGDFDVVLRSPGVPLLSAQIMWCRKKDIPITTPTNIFFALCKGRTIGVTGTKGKGTTSSLIYAMLKAAGRDAVLAGNIGTPMLDLLPQIKKETSVVLELSSFQLIDAAYSPNVAVVLMVTEDHLDFHLDVGDYVLAKSNILKYQRKDDAYVVNEDYASSAHMAELGQGVKYAVSARRKVDWGCYADENGVFISLEEEKEPLKVADLGDVRIPGRHNLENVCAAAMAAKLDGVPEEAMREALRKFQGLEHRLELVREIDGVKYYNDSFATNPSSTIAAIRAFDGPEILILGGSHKGSDFRELGDALREHGSIRAIIGIGEEWSRIKAAIGDAPWKVDEPKYVEGLTNMKDVVKAAREAAQPGDVVILSPACASFGMFKNYKDRGEQFKKEVNGL